MAETVPIPECWRKIEERKQAQIEEYNKRKQALEAEAEARRQAALANSEKYAMELVSTAEKEIQMQHEAEAANGYYVPAGAKIAFVIRIRGLCKIGPKPRKILQLFRLRQRGNGVFVRLNKATLQMLRVIEPWIAYGYPSPVVARELIFKLGFAKINGQRLPLSSDTLVHAAIGGSGIHSVEDLAHEIYTCGPNFTVATRFLWPFKLNQPLGGWRRIRNHWNEGGDYGNREEMMDDLIKACMHD